MSDPSNTVETRLKRGEYPQGDIFGIAQRTFFLEFLFEAASVVVMPWRSECGMMSVKYSLSRVSLGATIYARALWPGHGRNIAKTHIEEESPKIANLLEIFYYVL